MRLIDFPEFKDHLKAQEERADYLNELFIDLDIDEEVLT